MEHIDAAVSLADRGKAIAQNIKKYRTQNRLTQQGLRQKIIEKTGVELGKNAVAQIEIEARPEDENRPKGEPRQVSALELWALSEIFGVAPEALWSVPGLGEDEKLATLLRHARTTLASAHLVAHPQWQACMDIIKKVNAIMEERSDIVEPGKDTAGIFTAHDIEAIKTLMSIAAKQASLTQEIEAFVRGGLVANRVDH